MSLLGLDVGTTGCCAIAFNEAGVILAQAYVEYPLINPAPGHYELDPTRVWQSLAHCIREVNQSLARNPVKALAISAQGEAIIPVGEDKHPLTNSPVTSDTRAREQAEQLSANLPADDAYRITGHVIHGQYSLPKIMWWQQQQPEIYRQTWKFLTYGDFIIMCLGLNPVIDYTMAARTLAFDIQRHTWSDEILEVANVSRQKLPEILPAGTLAGTIPDTIARDLGFQDRVQVVVGGHDQPCAALGTGMLKSGQLMYSIGTTEAIAVVTDHRIAQTDSGYLPCYPHVVPEMYITLAGSQTGGRLLRWYRDEFGAAEQAVASQSDRDVYDVIVQQIPHTPGRLMVMPHFIGTGSLHNNPDASGAIIGLTFDTHRADIVRAILEGITYEQALTIQQMQAAGIVIEQIRAVGGGARSDVWLQIKADIIGLPVQAVQISEGASFGAALLAGWGTGIYSSLEDTVNTLVESRATFTPHPQHHAFYQDRLQLYQQLYAALEPLYLAL